MTKQKSILATITAIIGMLVLILDSKTAISGATEGLQLCLRVIIPTLFPYCILSITLTALLLGRTTSILRPFGKILKLPPNTESILLIGLLSGYPVGAQSIAYAYRQGALDRNNAERMIAFCNNAGPAFIFGVGSVIFDDPLTCCLVWFIHIVSSMLVGLITPSVTQDLLVTIKPKAFSFSQAFEQSIRTMASVCGWIVLFRTIIAVLDRWILWILPQDFRILVSGILELANGCTQLINSSNEAQQISLFTTMLGFGGICVLLQTYAIFAVNDLSIKQYFPGKLTHAAISYLLCISILSYQNDYTPRMISVILALCMCILYLFFFLKRQKVYGNFIVSGV